VVKHRQVVTIDTKSSTHWSLGINKEKENIIHALQKKYQIHGHEVYNAHKPVRECKKIGAIQSG
jgi:deoxycytidylate deaminase